MTIKNKSFQKRESETALRDLTLGSQTTSGNRASLSSFTLTSRNDDDAAAGGGDDDDDEGPVRFDVGCYVRMLLNVIDGVVPFVVAVASANATAVFIMLRTSEVHGKLHWNPSPPETTVCAYRSSY